MEEHRNRIPRTPLALVAVVVIVMAGYAGYNYYRDEVVGQEDLDQKLKAPVRSYVEMTVEYKDENHTIVMMLYEDKAPRTCANFRHYVESGFYDGTLFHRVIEGFMVQGGGMDLDGSQKETTAPPLRLETNDLRNTLGTVSTARLEGPNTATSQFFVNVADNPSLNPGGVDEYGYTVFGKVTEGFPVFISISKVATDDNDQPLEPVILWKVRMR